MGGRGIPCCRPPPGTADAMQYKGKLMFALAIAILIVEIPMGIWVFGNKDSPLSLMNNPDKGFPIDGNVVINYKCSHYDLGCDEKSFPTMCRDPDNWNKFMASMSPANCPEGYDFDGGSWIGADSTKKFAGVWKRADGACPASFGPFGSDKCKGQTMAMAMANPGPPDWSLVLESGCTDGCVFSPAWKMYKPSDYVKTMVEYEQSLNAPGFFFLDLVINLPIIMYLAFPLVMGPLSLCCCGWWTTTPGYGNCLSPICGCMDGDEVRQLRAEA